jgi:hypothetical protein
VAACVITVQAFWRQGPGFGRPCRYFWAISGAVGPEFTGTALADKFVGASMGITQVESGSGSSKCNLANIGIGEDDEQRDDV